MHTDSTKLTDTAKLLKECDAGTKMAISSINEILEKVNSYAELGERVLLLAKVSSVENSEVNSVTESDKTFGDSPTICANAQPVALVRCSERIRDDARKTLEWFREQGVRCRVISGDNPTTVASVAAKVGLTGERKPVAMDARKLPEDISELAKVLENVDVLGRVLPHQKKAIVQALHTQGHVVAMTGDGVNDTLALKEADLGVAMGNAKPNIKEAARYETTDNNHQGVAKAIYSAIAHNDELNKNKLL